MDRTETLWALWAALTGEFRTRRLLKGLTNSWVAWGFYGMDRISSLRRSRMAEGARALLAEVDDETLDALSALAHTNAARNDAMWRLAAMFYVSVPFGLFLASFDFASDFVKGLLSDLGATLLVLVAVMTVQMLYYFAVHWRARQVVAVLEILAVERGRTPLALQARRV